MTIEQFIIDLLKQHNCVVVPNFGGFIANYQPAIIDEISKTITPPSKQVIFNANLLKNDGLLANYVVDKWTITYPESLTAIESKTTDWKLALQENKRLAFGEIGFLYEQDGAIVFEQNRDTNLWLKAYGLSSIQFVPAANLAQEKPKEIPQEAPKIENETVKPVLSVEKTLAPAIELSESEKIETITNEEDGKVIPLVQEKQPRRKWGYIAAACAIPFLFYTYWIPMETNFLETGNIQLADFNPFQNKKTVSVYESRTPESVSLTDQNPSETITERVANLSADVDIYSFEFDEHIYIPVKVERPETAEMEAEMPVNTATATIADVSAAKEAPIQLVAGCFSVENNANNLVAQLKLNGYQAYILDKNKGLYRVAVKGFQNMKAAKTAKADLKSKNYSTWVLRK